MTQATEQLQIVQKYELFLNYMYPISRNIPRVHGVAKAMFIEDMLGQVGLFIAAGKSNQITRLYEADAGLAKLRYWLRFMSHPDRRIITMKQHQAGEVMLSETGRMLGAWITRKREPRGANG